MPLLSTSTQCTLYICLTVLLSPGSQALPEGPPTAACRTMQPGTRVGEVTVEGHVTKHQNDYPMYGNSRIPPYHIRFTPDTGQYEPDTEYTVRIVANQTTGHNYYKGILMQVRRVYCASNHTMEVEEDLYGTFSVPSSTSQTLLTTMDCFYEHSSLCHYSPQFKINETATWRSPDSHVGHLVFWATIVQTTTVYWTQVHSTILHDPFGDPIPMCGGWQIQGPVIMLMSALLVLYINRRSS